MPVPYATPDRPPEGEGIEWASVHFQSLKNLVEANLRAQVGIAATYGADVASGLLAAWWAPPGKKRGEAQPIADAQREIVTNPHKDGTYYVRVFKEPPDADSEEPLPPAKYYEAEGIAVASADGPAGFATFQTTAARANAELSSDLTLARARIEDRDAEIDKLRKVLRDTDDASAQLKRDNKAAEEKIEQLEANLKETSQPWMTEGDFATVLPLIRTLVEFPGGMGEHHLVQLVDAFVGTMNQIAAADLGILAKIAENKQSAEAWNVLAGVVNTVLDKRQAQSGRVPLAADILKNYRERPYRILAMHQSDLVRAQIAYKGGSATPVDVANLKTLPAIISELERAIGIPQSQLSAVDPEVARARKRVADAKKNAREAAKKPAKKSAQAPKKSPKKIARKRGK